MTAAIQIKASREDKAKSQSDAAFTLIETLVVVLIISIIVTVGILAFHNFGKQRRAKFAVQKFQMVIKAAQDEALFLPAIIGMKMLPHGYQFYRYQVHLKSQQGQWQRLKSDYLSNPHAFSKMLTVKKMQSKTAMIFIMPDGRISPFTLMLKNYFGKPIKLQIDAVGAVHATR